MLTSFRNVPAKWWYAFSASFKDGLCNSARLGKGSPLFVIVLCAASCVIPDLAHSVITLTQCSS